MPQTNVLRSAGEDHTPGAGRIQQEALTIYGNSRSSGKRQARPQARGRVKIYDAYIGDSSGTTWLSKIPKRMGAWSRPYLVLEGHNLVVDCSQIVLRIGFGT
jgi:hypothetical protein